MFNVCAPHRNVLLAEGIFEFKASSGAATDEALKHFCPGTTKAFVMELALMSLRKLNLSYGSCMPLGMVKRCTANILAGMEHVHRLGYVHRDLKPDNILISLLPDSGQLVANIGDLGSLSVTHGVGAMTRLVCTVIYRAPELFVQSIKASQRYGTEVDMWSCGVVLAELLIGRRVFELTEVLSESVRAISCRLGPPTGSAKSVFGGQREENQDMLNSGLEGPIQGQTATAPHRACGSGIVQRHVEMGARLQSSCRGRLAQQMVDSSSGWNRQLGRGNWGIKLRRGNCGRSLRRTGQR